MAFGSNPTDLNTDPNTDLRDRAHTRAVLMALARKREWYFEASLPLSVALSLLTLGIWPLLVQARRFDRFRRLEWNQYQAYAQWLSRTIGDSIAADLEQFAGKAAGRPSARFAVRLCVFGALAVAAIALFRTGDMLVLLKTVFVPQSLLWPAIAYSAILSIAWLVHLLNVIRQQTLTSLWIGRLNEMIAAHEKRPVPLVISKAPWPSLLVASLMAVLGPTWLAVALVALVIQNRYTRGTRAVRLAMVERMLEWMDTSGLPVEFDIEEIAPEELVAIS